MCVLMQILVHRENLIFFVLFTSRNTKPTKRIFLKGSSSPNCLRTSSFASKDSPRTTSLWKRTQRLSISPSRKCSLYTFTVCRIENSYCVIMWLLSELMDTKGPVRLIISCCQLIRNVDLREYLTEEAQVSEKNTTYDLVANVVHDGKPNEGAYRIHVLHHVSCRQHP